MGCNLGFKGWAQKNLIKRGCLGGDLSANRREDRQPLIQKGSQEHYK